MAKSINLADRIDFVLGDALETAMDPVFDAGMACWLLEHLERPEQLLQNLERNLRTGAYAFVTGALTAAEIDHVFEFRRESETITMAEDAGFRVLAMLSTAPRDHPEGARFLPRSQALVLQKRKKRYLVDARAQESAFSR